MVPQAGQKFSQSSLIGFRGVEGVRGNVSSESLIGVCAYSRKVTCFKLVGFMAAAVSDEETRRPRLDDEGGENDEGEGECDGDGDGDEKFDGDRDWDEVAGKVP